MTEPKARNAKITDFQPDPANPNKGSERGYRMLNDSLRKLGAGRSIVVDKNGIVIAGNKTQENAVDIGLEDAVVVQTDGNQIVVVQRTDLDLLNDPDHKARQLSIADNRTSDFMEWDAEQIQALVDQDLDLSDWFQADELEAIINALPNDNDWLNAMGGLPGEDRAPFQQMTFTLHDSQVELVNRALKLAKDLKNFVDSENQNSNGNALAFVCAEFIQVNDNG